MVKRPSVARPEAMIFRDGMTSSEEAGEAWYSR